MQEYALLIHTSKNSSMHVYILIEREFHDYMISIPSCKHRLDGLATDSIFLYVQIFSIVLNNLA